MARQVYLSYKKLGPVTLTAAQWDTRAGFSIKFTKSAASAVSPKAINYTPNSFLF